MDNIYLLSFYSLKLKYKFPYIFLFFPSLKLILLNIFLNIKNSHTSVNQYFDKNLSPALLYCPVNFGLCNA